jgi:hypothetical protein
MTTFSATAVLISVSTILYAQTPLCSCPTTGAAVYMNSGGDSSPLNWKFEARNKTIGSRPQSKQVICYTRQVENRSSLDVTDVLWRIAGYKRDLIIAGGVRPSCNDYPGEIKQTVDQGPLHHGVSSQAYDTTVRPPESGWYETKAQVEADDVPPLRSDFVLDTRAKDGSLRTAHVVMEAAANYDGKSSVFNFRVANNGDGVVGFLLNLRALPQMFKDVPAVERPFYLGPKENVTFKSASMGRPEFAPTTVVFYGEDGQEAALETAGFYVPQGGKLLRSNEQLWSTGR